MITAATSFVIDRKIWFRGRGGDNSRLLLDRDALLRAGEPLGARQQCCVGIYLSACGLTDDDLRGESAADPVLGNTPAADGSLRWMEHDPYLNGEDRTNGVLSDIYVAYKQNDSRVLTDDVREAAIAAIFLKHGVTVTFIN